MHDMSSPLFGQATQMLGASLGTGGQNGGLNPLYQIGGPRSALMAAMVTPMMADEFNKETKLEFSGPVEVPGKVLAAGKYVFKIADSESDRNIVQIFSEDAK